MYYIHTVHAAHNYTYICVHVVYIHIHVCTHVCMYIRLYMSMYMCVRFVHVHVVQLLLLLHNIYVHVY